MGVRLLFGAGPAWLRKPRVLHWLRIAALAVIAVSGVWIYAGYVDTTYPIRHWLAWPLLTLCGYTALLNLAYFSLGNLILRRFLGERELPLLESNVTSAALGVFAFTMLMYVAGAFGWYGPTFSILLPVAMIAVGAVDLRELWQQHRSAAIEPVAPTLPTLLLWAFGAFLTGILYLGLLTPDSLNYDATWSHLTVAQDYAREGRIVPFPADYNKNVPQLASILHTWDFSVPGLSHPALRWMLVLHQEFALLLWTLAGVSAAVRRMSGARAGGAWAAFYLFPMIFVYDHNLGGAADHVAAFFTLPAMMAIVRLQEQLSWRRAAPLAAFMASGLLTKYQSTFWVVPMLAYVGIHLLWKAWSAYRVGALRSALPGILQVGLVLALGVPLLTAPHFLKNWLFFRNPAYPFLQQVFTSTQPTVKDAAFLFTHTFTDLNWVPKGTLFEKLKESVGLVLTFSFEPHYSFTKNFPAFGSLFTLLLPAMLLVPRRAAKLPYVVVSLGALFLWGYVFHIDRNLQIFSPILIACTVAILHEVWRLGWAGRLAIAPVVIFQLIWGGDAYFYSSRDRIRSAIDLISSGYAGNAERRFDGFRSTYTTLGKAMPKDATLLFHSAHPTLGIDRRVYFDWAGFQGLISYDRVRNQRDMYDLYKKLGITHILYIRGQMPAASIQEEITFQRLTEWMGAPIENVGGHHLWEIPASPPPAEPAYRVLTLGLYGYGTGIFPIEQLSTNEHIRPDRRVYARPPAPAPSTMEDLEASQIDAVVVGAGATLNAAQNKFLDRHFRSVISYPNQQTIYLPKR
jgi:hypothetical protein